MTVEHAVAVRAGGSVARPAAGRYDHDPRVAARGDGYTVHADDGTVYAVLPNEALGWGIYTGPNLDLVPTAGGGFAVGIVTADAAIAALIGDPQ